MKTKMITRLLPLAGLAGAVPIVGIAPIMVMWFGFDWHSKAAVAAIALSALAGSAFYGLIALVERRLTFWHPSYRA